MLLESVTSIAFGPFLRATLEFAQQFTIVYGPNESGKSNWHAAIYAAICGMRRGRGQSKTDRDFAEARRPWSSDHWEVRATVRLDDGRRVELRQNLADLAHCAATDADFGRDVMEEILNEGTPDASRWLGLDRQSFLSVACVRQAEVQNVAASAEALQEELQRAAASAPRDATAAEAIDRMEDYFKNHVGLDRANSTKPLQRAKLAVISADAALRTARQKHAAWLAMEAQAVDLRAKAQAAERKLGVLRAQQAQQEADSWRARLDRARVLAEAYPQGPPARSPEDDALADEVASALGSWRSRPEVRDLDGESSAAIRAALEALPAVPSGHRAPHPDVVTAMKAYERASQALELHEGRRPPDSPETHARLSRPVLLGMAVSGVLGGLGAGAFWNWWAGAALIGLGVIALVLSQRQAAEDVRAAMNRQALAAWSKAGRELRAELTAAATLFAQRLSDAGIPEATDLPAAFQRYEQECRTRAEQAARAGMRQSLSQQLENREAAEQTVDAARVQRLRAEQKILAVAAQCHLNETDPDSAAMGLSRWQIQHKTASAKFDQAAQEYAQLPALLDGGTLAGLAELTEDRERHAAGLAGEFGPLGSIALNGNLDHDIHDAQELAQHAAKSAIASESVARERAQDVPSVSEAEEALAAAEQELERVSRLGRTLTDTLDFLRAAEDRVHRNIAPQLAAGLRRWLSQVTQGRYIDARVDPRDLSVQVMRSSQEWHDARHLSHGTAEQIYLLLRAVLAERLATTGETCPLILDDVLVQSDRVRKLAMLDVLATLSRSRQVILFTQEEEVVRWGRERMPGCVVVLPGPTVP